MIPSLTSPVLTDHRDLGLLSDQLRLPQNSGPLHSFALGEAHSHMGTLRLVALVVLVPYGHLEHMEECMLVDKRHLPFSGRFELSHLGIWA